MGWAVLYGLKKKKEEEELLTLFLLFSLMSLNSLNRDCQSASPISYPKTFISLDKNHEILKPHIQVNRGNLATQGRGNSPFVLLHLGYYFCLHRMLSLRLLLMKSMHVHSSGIICFTCLSPTAQNSDC